MSQTSLAAVFVGPGAPLELNRYPIPSLAPTAALARISYATICGSDLHSYFGRRHSPVPCVLGHEMVGRIAAVGPEGACDWKGEPLAIGDRVTWSMVWSCGECWFCRHGLRAKCERLIKFGHEKMSAGNELTGGMAEHCVLPPGTAIFRVPDNVPDRVASPANCATATVAAVFRAVGDTDGQVVTIHGAGMLGLTACAMAANRGAAAVIVVEPNAARREHARSFGAAEVLDSAMPRQELSDHVKARTAGRGADVGLEFAGYPESIETGIGLLRYGGSFIMAGATFPSRPVHLDAEQLVRRMITMRGVYNYSPEDLGAALDFLSSVVDRCPFADLVGAEFPLSEVSQAMQFAETGNPPRVGLIA